MCFMLLRFYFLFKAIFNYSQLSNAFSKRLCRLHDFYPGFRFILKSNFIERPE